jgi:hypothetical protein
MSPLPHDQLKISIITNVMLSISHYIILKSPLPHEELPINFITKFILFKSHYKYTYVTTPTLSVTNKFHYERYAIHITLYNP